MDTFNNTMINAYILGGIVLIAILLVGILAKKTK